MIVDDRLATVLGTDAASPGAARTQYRQLVDLLGRGADGELPEIAVARLDELDQRLSVAVRESILRSMASGLRNPALIALLAAGPPAVAAAAIAAGRLDDAQWAEMIVALPMRARGFLRHRRDLGPRARMILTRFGIGDMALPLPDDFESHVIEAPATPIQIAPENEGIGAIVRRIEAFRRNRERGEAHGTEDPRLPLSELDAPAPRRITAIQFASDARDRIVWADDGCAPMLAELPIALSEPLSPARCDAASARAVRQRRPVRGGRIEIDGAAAVAGAWRIDAAPRFAAHGGRFLGYRGVLRRPEDEAAAPADEHDRLRQLLHELRTPLNAIQGFAELIQQQLFGPTPHQYRSYAASIVADSAQVLAGFDEIERLAKLESGRGDDMAGRCDVSALVARVVRQLGPATVPRGVAFEFEAAGAAPVAMAEPEAERMVWRVLATLAAAALPGEAIAIELAAHGEAIELAIALPAALAARDDEALFAVEPAAAAAGHLALGLLGGGFALRLARAEARAAGGALRRDRDRLLLGLPGLTPRADANSPGFAPAVAAPPHH